MATLDELEKSVEASRPVELYTFSFGAEVFRFTSAEGTVTFSGADYEPLSLKRSNPVQAKEQKSTALRITLPTDSDPARPFIAIQPSLTMDVLIQRVQPDAVPASASIVMFDGFVSSVSFEDEKAEFRCIPFNELFTREMPRFQYQGLCNHVLYDARCKVVEGSFKHTGTVLGVVGKEIQIQGLPTAGLPFIGGYVEIPGGSEQRLIIDQVGITVTVLFPFLADVSGGSLDAFQGCDHTATTCAQKFNNILNHGGHPFVPTINPFNQTQITKE